MYSLTDMCGLVNYNMNQLQWEFTRNEVNKKNQPMSMYIILYVAKSSVLKYRNVQNKPAKTSSELYKGHLMTMYTIMHVGVCTI